MNTNISWNLIDVACTSIVAQIREARTPPLSIYAVPRGGLVPGVILSHALGVQLCDLNAVDEHTLVVDELCDSGTTMLRIYGSRTIRELDAPPASACLFEKAGSLFHPTYLGDPKIYDTAEWLVFPWEPKDL